MQLSRFSGSPAAVRRSWSLVTGLAVLVGLLVVGATVPAPWLGIGRGPTYDTLGEVGGNEVVSVADGLTTYPTSGNLNMTTVGVTDRLTMLRALAMWASGDFQVVARSALIPPGSSAGEVTERNRTQFLDSQTSAETAALVHLGLPTTVVVEGLTTDSAVAGVLEPGDVLETVDGQQLDSLPDLTATLRQTRPGESVTVRFRRGDGGAQEEAVTLGPRPDGPHGALGLVPSARPVVAERIRFALDDIGGPSAGLIFALAAVDKLTPGELTGGRFVAGTGTIHPTGAVGGINGIPFKMRAARDAGATVFLAPAVNCAEAARSTPEGLQVVRVETLTDAVSALETLDGGGTPPGC